MTKLVQSFKIPPGMNNEYMPFGHGIFSHILFGCRQIGC